MCILWRAPKIPSPGDAHITPSLPTTSNNSFATILFTLPAKCPLLQDFPDLSLGQTWFLPLFNHQNNLLSFFYGTHCNLVSKILYLWAFPLFSHHVWKSLPGMTAAYSPSFCCSVLHTRYMCYTEQLSTLPMLDSMLTQHPWESCYRTLLKL